MGENVQVEYIGNLFNTNRTRGPFWGIKARVRGSVDGAQLGPHKDDRGPIFLIRTARK